MISSKMNGDSSSAGQSLPFGYVPNGLDMEIGESFQDGSSLPILDETFPYQSWVDEVWDNELQSMLGRSSENDLLGMRDECESGSFTPIDKVFSMSEELNEFDEAFGSFCHVLPLNYDNLSSSSNESTWKVESNNKCSAPDCGGVTFSKSPDKSSEEARNGCEAKEYHHRTPPSIIVTHSQGDQDAQPLQSLPDIGEAMAQKTSMAKPILKNPIQLHFNDSGELKFLVLLSLNELRTLKPMWFNLYWEKFEKESTISGSRASLSKRK